MDRFWNKVRIQGDCWIWRTGKRAYFWVDGGLVLAYRYAYEQMIGEIPPGLELDHLCRNPACVNPYHLDPVPRLVNLERGLHKGPNSDLTHCQNGHEFNEQNTYVYPSGRRRCRLCNNTWARNYKQQKCGVSHVD